VLYDAFKIPSRGGGGKLTRERRATPSGAPTLDEFQKTRVSPSGCLCCWRSAIRSTRLLLAHQEPCDGRL
jgi:hypothetical protein